MAVTIGDSTFTANLGNVIDERASINNNILVIAMSKTSQNLTYSTDINEILDIMGVTFIVTITGQIHGDMVTIRQKVTGIRAWVDSPDMGGNGKGYTSDTLGTITGDNLESPARTVYVTPLSFDGSFSTSQPFTYNYTLSMARGLDTIGDPTGT